MKVPFTETFGMQLSKFFLLLLETGSHRVSHGIQPLGKELQATNDC